MRRSRRNEQPSVRSAEQAAGDRLLWQEYSNDISVLAQRRGSCRPSGQRRGNIVTPSRGDWDALRQAVRAEAQRRGLTVADVADTLGRGPSALRTSLSLRHPPSAALQDALRGWMGGGWPSDTSRAAQAAGGASQARHGHGQRPGGGDGRHGSGAPEPTTPAPAPPSADDPRSRMCALSAKNMVRGDIVSASITRPQWEYAVHRLPDHDWSAQVEHLNALGKGGWSLVSVSGGVAYLKRVVL